MACGASWMAPDGDRGSRLIPGQEQAVARYEALPRAGASLPVTVIVASRPGGAHPRGKTTNTLRAPAEMYPSQVVWLQTYGSKLPESVAVPSTLTDLTGLAKSPVNPTTKSTTITTTAITTTGHAPDRAPAPDRRLVG